MGFQEMILVRSHAPMPTETQGMKETVGRRTATPVGARLQEKFVLKPFVSTLTKMQEDQSQHCSQKTMTMGLVKRQTQSHVQMLMETLVMKETVGRRIVIHVGARLPGKFALKHFVLPTSIKILVRVNHL